MEVEMIALNPAHVGLLSVLLAGVGKAMKSLPRVPDEVIPVTLAVVGGAATGWLNGWRPDAMLAGAAVGLMTTGAHQVVKQFFPKREGGAAAGVEGSEEKKDEGPKS